MEVYASVPNKSRKKRIINMSWAQLLWMWHKDVPTRTSPEVLLERLPKSLKRKGFRWPADPEYVGGVMIDDVEYHVVKTKELKTGSVSSEKADEFFVGVTLDPSLGKSFPSQITKLAYFPDKRALYKALPFQHYLGGVLGPYEFESYYRYKDTPSG